MDSQGGRSVLCSVDWIGRMLMIPVNADLLLCTGVHSKGILISGPEAMRDFQDLDLPEGFTSFPQFHLQQHSALRCVVVTHDLSYIKIFLRSGSH